MAILFISLAHIQAQINQVSSEGSENGSPNEWSVTGGGWQAGAPSGGAGGANLETGWRLGTSGAFQQSGATTGKLTVSISGKGTVSKGFEGITIQPVGPPPISIKATPARGYLFGYWSDADNGDVLSTELDYSFIMPSFLDLEANFVVNPFLAAGGSYLALLRGESYAESGFAKMTVNTNGRFTITYNLGGKSVRVSNAFDSLGQYQGGFTVPGGSTFDTALSLTAGGLLSGTLTSQSDGSQIAVNTERTEAHDIPALAGAYTALLPVVTGSDSLPGGNGYGTLTVSRTGTVRFAGKLGDGVPMTFSGYLDGNGVWPFLFVKAASRNAGAELLLGKVTFPPPASGTAGILDWYRTANANDIVYPDGFLTTIPLLTGYYRQPAVSSTAASITFSGADVFTPIVKTLSIAGNDKVTYLGADKFTLKFTARTGSFTGSFEDNTVTRTFSGAVLQSGSFGLGLFRVDTGQTGSVMIQGSR